MQKLIFVLVGISFITVLSFGTALAQEENEDQDQSSITKKIKNKFKYKNTDDDRIGLDISGFLGTAQMDEISKPAHPKNTYYGKNSDNSFPAYNFNVSYALGRKTFLLGLGYQYNTIEFTTTELSENDNTYYREKYSKSKIHQFSLDLKVTTNSDSFNVYIGLNLFPFMKIEGKGRSNTPKFAWGWLLGLKYNVYGCMNLLLQGSFEYSVKVSVKDNNNTRVDQSFYISNLLLGIGISL